MDYTSKIAHSPAEPASSAPTPGEKFGCRCSCPLSSDFDDWAVAVAATPLEPLSLPHSPGGQHVLLRLADEAAAPRSTRGLERRHIRTSSRAAVCAVHSRLCCWPSAERELRDAVLPSLPVTARRCFSASHAARRHPGLDGYPGAYSSSSPLAAPDTRWAVLTSATVDHHGSCPAGASEAIFGIRFARLDNAMPIVLSRGR
eukprot:760584-Hanusia_phi.AAC.3